MRKIWPAIVIGIGPQAQQTVEHYVRHIHTREGRIAGILSVIIDFSSTAFPFRRRTEQIQYLTLTSPVFDQDEEWPTWLPVELADIPASERARTRAWLRAAVLQEADDLQEFLLESIPHLSSFAAVEEMHAAGVTLAGDSRIRIYVVADLGDHLGSSVSVDIAYLTHHVCQQLGLQPSTTGLFFLPSATYPAPAEEAVAYAALRELEHYFVTRRYSGEFTPDGAAIEDLAPFQDGCYLLDNVNELGYTLEDPAQQVATVSEWLYAMTLLGMQDAVSEHRPRRYLTGTLRGKSRAYESLGLAVRYVPQEPLTDWAAARLGSAVIGRVLEAPVNGSPAKDTTAFIARMGLYVDDLSKRLSQHVQVQQIEETLAPIQSSNLSQIESTARQVLQTIRERQLPVLDQRLTKAGELVQQEISQAVHDQVHATLQDRSRRGIRAAECFLELLYEHTSALQHEVEELAKRHRVELKQSLATISKTHYVLRSVVMSIPPWPVAVLGVISAVALPLVYCLQLISQVIRPLNRIWADVALGVLLAGILGVSGLVVARLWRQRRLVSDQHKHMIRERFELESKPLFSRAIRAVCSAVQETIDEARRDLEPLVSQLQTVASQYDRQADRIARELEDLAAPGPFRSMIGVKQAEQFYTQWSLDEDQLLDKLTTEIGYIADWEAESREQAEPLSSWLSDQLSKESIRYLRQRGPLLSALDVMTKNSSQVELQHDLERMFQSARPMWNYDPHVLRRAKTQRLTLVGVDTGGSGWANAVEPLVQRFPEVISIDTGDPSTLVILQVHHGVPLFALRRISEYRAHYAEMLWHSKLPVHTMRALALDEDLIPFRRRTRLPTRSLFAVGLALGTITREADGRYVAPRAQGQTTRLSTRKERAVALMGLDSATCREAQRQLEALVAKKGKRALHTILDEYMTVIPDLEDWEVKGILDFDRIYGLGNGNNQHAK